MFYFQMCVSFMGYFVSSYVSSLCVFRCVTSSWDVLFLDVSSSFCLTMGSVWTDAVGRQKFALMDLGRATSAVCTVVGE